MNALPALLQGAPATALLRLTIRDFRNLASAELEPPREGMVVIGENGQGKTNLLEAIYYLQLLRSFRGARDADLVRFDTAGFFLSSSLEGGAASEIAVGFEPRGGRAARRNGARKRVRLNGAEPPRLADALGVFPAVIFSPQDAAIVSGAPAARRRFLDVTLALTSRPYLSALQRYRAALVQRNAAMRGISSGTTQVEARVAVWEPALAEHGAVLWRARREWVDRHASRFAELCASIGEEGTARMRFVSGMEDPERAGVELREALERKRTLDIRRGVTHAGPHRDDLEMTLDGRDLRTYGSAGQQRTAAMALRLLEGATLREHARAEPVVLLDDPFAELDARRSARILELLEGTGRSQTVLVVPRSTDIPEGLTRLERWRIAGGVLAR
jgi:DNA replication and repair protein RecF